MEERITKLEKEISIMAHTHQAMNESLRKIAAALEQNGEWHMDTKLLEERLHHLDDNLRESFSRVHNRIDAINKKMEKDAEKRAKTLDWAVMIVIGGLLSALVTFIVKGGLST